jgi:hypothetical protein
MLRSRVGFLPLIAALLILAGCNRGPQMAEVEGTVKLNGKALDKIQVEFWPEVNGPRSVAVTDANGRFALASDNGQMKGAVVGPHRVVLRDIGVWGEQVLGRGAEGVDLTKGKKPRIPSKYNDSNTTTLKKDVQPGKNDIEVEVTP